MSRANNTLPRISEDEVEDLRANQRFLVRELQRRGIAVSVFDWDYQVLYAEHRGRGEFLLDLDSSVIPYPSTIIFGDKFLTKKVLMQRGIAVPRGQKFWFGDEDKAVEFAAALGSSVVVKSVHASQGKRVLMDLASADELRLAIERIVDRQGVSGYLVEEQVGGAVIRIFVNKYGDYAALRCEPPSVIGDGHSTIEALIDRETERRMLPARTSCLGPIEIDLAVEEHLKKHALTIYDVPPKDERVVLRANTNIGTGGSCEDFTEKLDRSFLELAYKVLGTCPRVPYLSIDFITKDPEAPQTPDSYRVISVNSIPAVGMHMAPGRGGPRDVAKMIVDVVFPDTRALAV